MFNFEELKEEEEELKKQFVEEFLQKFKSQFVGDLKEIGEVDEDQLENITYYVEQVDAKKVERIEKQIIT